MKYFPTKLLIIFQFQETKQMLCGRTHTNIKLSGQKVLETFKDEKKQQRTVYLH